MGEMSAINTEEISPLIKVKDLDNSSLDSNAWLAGFSDADANFSINIHKRSNKNYTRVQLYYRLEIAQAYKKVSSTIKEETFLHIMSINSWIIKIGYTCLNYKKLIPSLNYFIFRKSYKY